MKYLLGCWCILLCTFSSFGQTKNEKEERIDLRQLPEAAVEIIKSLPKDCKKIKFYKETDNEHKSFESKFKFKKYRYSIEFTPEGVIEDIEVTVKFKSVNKETKAKISDYFKQNYQKHKVLKTQKQYIPEDNIYPEKFVEKILNKKAELQPNYEIIVEVKSKSEHAIKEFTFNFFGEVILIRTVNPSSYEHVLY